MSIAALCQKIRLILSDVDGVMTDGGIIFDNQGIEAKRFNVRDGQGIKLWQRSGGTFGILTSRNSHIVKVRATELGIDIVRQGFAEKRPAAMEVITQLGLTPDAVAYIGDDLPDVPVLRSVALGVAVADAASEAKAAARHVTHAPGGAGAVRETVELILKAQNRWHEAIARFME